MPNLFLGDSLDVLKTLPENSIDSLVTDPPAGIGFMSNGKKDHWDSDKGGRDHWILWMTEIMKEALRVMKPGAHGLVWCLPRTSHWTMTAVEDAGFDVRDVVQHIFGSGFPKSLNVLKNIEKEYACKVEKVNAKIAENFLNQFCAPHETGGRDFVVENAWELLKEQDKCVVVNFAQKNFTLQEHISHEKTEDSKERFVLLVAKQNGSNALQVKIIQIGRVENLSAAMDTLPCISVTANIALSTISLLKKTLEEFSVETKRYITLTELETITELKIFNLLRNQNTLNCITEINHTALKPAVEFYILIRKPLSEKTVASNVLKHGCGGLNIDASRIEAVDQTDLAKNWDRTQSEHNKSGTIAREGGDLKPIDLRGRAPTGRFPSHLVLDEEAAKMLDEQSGILKTGELKGYESKESENKCMSGKNYHRVFTKSTKSEGGASRFYYVAKASKSDKNFGLDGMDLIWESDVWEKQVQNLLMENINLLPKDISDDQLTASKQWSTDLFGNNISEQSPTGLMYTIETVLKLITELKTLNSSQSSRIKESTQDAIRMINRNGLSLAKSVEFLNQWKPNTTKDQTEYTLGVVLAFAQVLKQIMSYAKSGNFHNTVKSTKLMEYLIKLITPPNGVVLDCFMGSGSTGVSAKRAGFQFIGIEKEPEYFEIAEKRLSAS